MTIDVSPASGGRPLIVLVFRVELLGEALRGALDEIADVRAFSASLGDTDGLLRSLSPDAVVVDDEHIAQAALPYVSASDSALVHVSVHDDRVRLFIDGEWIEEVEGGTSPEAIRNVLIGRLLGRASRV